MIPRRNNEKGNKSKVMLAGLTAALLGVSTLSSSAADSAAAVAQKGLADLAKGVYSTGPNGEKQRQQAH